MAWLGAKVHGQVVLQGQVDGGKLVVDEHVGQRRHIRCWDETHIEEEVVEHQPDERQGEGVGVHEGIGRDLQLVQVLWDGSLQGFYPLDFLWRLLQGGPNAFEGVLFILSFLFPSGFPQSASHHLHWGRSRDNILSTPCRRLLESEDSGRKSYPLMDTQQR